MLMTHGSAWRDFLRPQSTLCAYKLPKTPCGAASSPLPSLQVRTCTTSGRHGQLLWAFPPQAAFHHDPQRGTFIAMTYSAAFLRRVNG